MSDRVITGLLAFFLGGFGAHKFYLGRFQTGLIYLALLWTSIPIFVGIYEGLYYLTISNEEFEERGFRKR